MKLKVDSHTHWCRDWAKRDGEDPSRWLAQAREYGVTHSVVMPDLGLVDARAIAAEHDHLARVCARSEGAMIPFCTACLAEPDTALSEVRRCLGGLKFRGVKFHPWLQGCSVSDPAMDAVAELAAEFGVPIAFHDGTPPYSLPSQMALLAQRHPRTAIVLGHGGLFEHCQEAAAAVNSAENVWACLCGPHLEGLRYLVAHCPIERLLWGTDVTSLAINPYLYRAPLMGLLHLTPAQARAIYHANPQRLFKLEDRKETR